ncbi:protein Lines homolog 1 [Melanotaenia boesemani]|uniref:protein Lines homolog 1 n=1 Tax=Melanotaenia boesemani TaxID=1250792 RepID=UPI001C055EF7|nr:protein Lines homolog 1 [Melanotaenia boesemani]
MMDLPARLQSSTSLFNALTETFTCSVNGSFPGLRPNDVVAAIFSGLCGPVPGGNREELTCLSLTVVRRMTSGVLSRRLSADVEPGWVEVLRGLFQDMDLMSQLVQLFEAEDQLISHLAARTASLTVFYLLRESGVLSPAWQKKCVQTFHSSAPGPELDSCLWSLTELLKKLLRGTDPVILGNVVAVFVCSLGVLCSKLLPEDGEQTPSSVPRGTTLYLLMDLLEVLTAAGSVCGSGLAIIPTHSSALLRTIGCSSQYFVRRRVLLLLKRSLFQKLGEDWSLSSGSTHTDLSSGVCALARCVLANVAENWLQTIHMEQDCSFGGTGSIRGFEGRTPDDVVLRAISLILLKSIQVQIQQTGAADGVDRARTYWTGLQSLWDFLRRSDASLRDLPHPCFWISQLFGEQDDDLMEAASTCLSVFLTFRQSSELDDGIVLEAACSSGCNPHCHFILLLQSFSFDHSILLDFLISMETCFLEYFVCYLKFLREDWQGFFAACGVIGSSDGPLPGTGRGFRLSDGLLSGSHGGVGPEGRSSLGSGLRLVEYDSSDESDPEDPEDSELLEKTRWNVLDWNQNQSRTRSVDEPPAASLRGSDSAVRRAVLVSPNRPSLSPPPGRETCETLSRAVLCLTELRDVVRRLQKKNLFPYNPSPLLKLLSQLDHC